MLVQYVGASMVWRTLLMIGGIPRKKTKTKDQTWTWNRWAKRTLLEQGTPHNGSFHSRCTGELPPAPPLDVAAHESI